MENNIYKVITASGTGSCFFLPSHNSFITSYHVVQGSKEVALQDTAKNRYLAKVVMVNPEVDLAILKCNVPTSNKDHIRISSEVEINNTNKVYIHGYPFGLPYTVTEGIVSSPKQMIGQRYFIQTDAAINPGNSGGPMLNSDGMLIGVTTARVASADNMGFAIPHFDVEKELNEFKISDDKFHVKCNSCNHFISERSEFCENCGNTIEKSVFEDVELSNFAVFVEDALSELDMNPVLARAGRDQWEFHQGSALIRIFVFRGDYIFATSPLNKLPTEKLGGLYKHLLSESISPYKFGINENHIYISYRAHISDMFSSYADDVKRNITNLAIKADELDDFFVNEFACEMSIESKT